MIVRRWRWSAPPAAVMGLAALALACASDPASPDGWATVREQSVAVGALPVGRVERQVRRVGSCADSVRDLFSAEWPGADSLWLAWRDSLPATPGSGARVVVDGTMLTPTRSGGLVLRAAAAPGCDAATRWPPASWFSGVAWRGGAATVASGFTWYAGTAELRDTTFARCRGPARLINGDGASVLAFGGCTFRALPPLITGLVSLDPAAPGSQPPQDQFRLVGLGRISGGASPRDTLLLRVEMLRTEGMARGTRDTAQMLVGRRAP